MSENYYIRILFNYNVVGRDPPAYRPRSRPRAGQAGNHVDQSVRSETRPTATVKQLIAFALFVSLILLTIYDSAAMKTPTKFV